MTKSNHYRSAVIAIIVVLILLPTTIQETTASLQHTITSPKNTIYNKNQVPLNISIRTTNGFRFGYSNYVNEIFYCLDEKANVTIPFTVSQTGDQDTQHYNYKALTFLTGLSDGDHNVIVYAANTYPFTIESIDFVIGYTLKTPTPTPTPSIPPSPPKDGPPTSPSLILPLTGVITIIIVGSIILAEKLSKKRREDPK